MEQYTCLHLLYLSFGLAPALDYIAGEGVGTDEIMQLATWRLKDSVPVPLPEHLSFVDESDLVSDFQNRIHVVSIYHRGHVELLGQVMDESVYQDGCIWVEA